MDSGLQIASLHLTFIRFNVLYFRKFGNRENTTMEWAIDFRLNRKGASLATATFVYKDVEIGSVDVDPQSRGRGDFAFVELIKRPHRWNSMPSELHDALLIYRKETLAEVDYRDKTYRFVDADGIVGSQWKLTTDKSDIRIPKDADTCIAS